MIFSRYNNIKLFGYIIIVVVVLVNSSCHRKGIQNTVVKPSIPISLKTIAGIDYTEVRRRLNTGLSFDDYGFETEPGYKITFLKNDSASVYSPDKKAFINFYVFMEKDSIFNVARSYFKMMKMSKDSIIMQVLEVEGDTLHTRRSLVYMTFYANKYIKEHNLNVQELGKPDRKDTLFIQHKADIANKNLDSAFSARQPAELKSKSPLLTIARTDIQPDISNNFDASDAYMNPEYDIIIKKAYENFSYSIAVFIDDKGKLYFDRSMDYIMPEFKESTIKTLKAIIDGYLSAYLAIKPGSTLGIKHTSFVILNVHGRK